MWARAEMEELERVAPAEIAADVQVITASIREVARTGDLGHFDESEESEARIKEFESRECGPTS